MTTSDIETLDTLVLAANRVCAKLEASRDSLPAIVKHILDMRCDDSIKIEKLRQVMADYEIVRDWVGDKTMLP